MASTRLTPGTVLLLVVPPLMWAANAVVGRAVRDLVPPLTLNFLRWAFAFVVLLPFAARVLRPRSELWRHAGWYALLGLVGIGSYNALQYLALQTSTPINVTLVASSVPLFMLAIGAIGFGAAVSRRALIGAALSIAGVLLVLAHGDPARLLELKLVAGDVIILIATALWALYSWLLSRTDGPASIRDDWAAFLMAQVVFGVMWSGAFAAGEQALLTPEPIRWGWPLVAGLAFIVIGPAILAYRCWGAGVRRVGPTVAGFFQNLTPLLAAILSAAFLGAAPHWYHAAAFVLIVAGIVLSARA